MIRQILTWIGINSHPNQPTETLLHPHQPTETLIRKNNELIKLFAYKLYTWNRDFIEKHSPNPDIGCILATVPTGPYAHFLKEFRREAAKEKAAKEKAIKEKL